MLNTLKEQVAGKTYRTDIQADFCCKIFFDAKHAGVSAEEVLSKLDDYCSQRAVDIAITSPGSSGKFSMVFINTHFDRVDAVSIVELLNSADLCGESVFVSQLHKDGNYHTIGYSLFYRENKSVDSPLKCHSDITLKIRSDDVDEIDWQKVDDLLEVITDQLKD